jgi:hypothetical protein
METHEKQSRHSTGGAHRASHIAERQQAIDDKGRGAGILGCICVAAVYKILQIGACEKVSGLDRRTTKQLQKGHSNKKTCHRKKRMSKLT